MAKYIDIPRTARRTQGNVIDHTMPNGSNGPLTRDTGEEAVGGNYKHFDSKNVHMIRKIKGTLTTQRRAVLQIF